MGVVVPSIGVNDDLAMLLGPLGFLNGPWVQVQGGASLVLVSLLSNSVGLLCKFSAFLSSLHWLVGAEDLGQSGVSYLEVLIVFEQWAGQRLLSEKVTRPHARAHRPNFYFFCSCVRRNRNSAGVPFHQQPG